MMSFHQVKQQDVLLEKYKKNLFIKKFCKSYVLNSESYLHVTNQEREENQPKNTYCNTEQGLAKIYTCGYILAIRTVKKKR